MNHLYLHRINNECDSVMVYPLVFLHEYFLLTNILDNIPSPSDYALLLFERFSVKPFYCEYIYYQHVLFSDTLVWNYGLCYSIETIQPIAFDGRKFALSFQKKKTDL